LPNFLVPTTTITKLVQRIKINITNKPTLTMKFLNTTFLGLSAIAVISTTSTTSAFSVVPRSSSTSSRVSLNVLSATTDAAKAEELFQRSLLKQKFEYDAKSATATSSTSETKPLKSLEKHERKTVYVGNLPFSTTKDQILELFTGAGINVITVAMPLNPDMIDEATGLKKSKGFAFVDVESEEMIEAAVEALNQVELDGRTMRVNKLLPKEEIAARDNKRDRNYTTDGKKKLYVGNLKFEATVDEISALFSEYGVVSDTYLPNRDGNPRGFCFVTMNAEGADKAMAELDGHNFQGRDLVVNEPLKKGEKSPSRNARPAYKLYVGNLSFYTSADTLLSVFQEFGEVYDCYLPTDPNTDQARGFGFVTMLQEDGENAIAELDGLELDGRFIRVNEAQGKRRTVETYTNVEDNNNGGGDFNGGEE